MPDEFYSQITRTELMSPLRNLLGIRGPKEVPEKIDVRDVKLTADILNTWAGYERHDVRHYAALNGLTTYVRNIVGEDSAAGGITYVLNTQGKEALIVCFTLRLVFSGAGAAAHAGFNNHFQIYYSTGFPNFNAVPHAMMEVDTQGTVLTYILSTGGFNNMANGIPFFKASIYPWLSSGFGLGIQLDTNNAWPAATQLFADTLVILGPKNGKLPSLG